MIGWIRLETTKGDILGVHVSHIATFIIPKDKKKPIQMVLAVGDGLTHEITGTEKDLVDAIGSAYRP